MRSLFRHKKSGEIYEQINTATIKLASEWVPCIIYKKYGDRGLGKVFVRLEADFNGVFISIGATKDKELEE